MEQRLATLPNRYHVTDPFNWARSAGTDFWITAHNNVAAAGTFPDDLADYEWVTTALALQAGSAADHISSADPGTPRAFLTDASGDRLQSPNIFGDYSNALVAKSFLGYLPTLLVAEFYAAFSVASANETNSQIGFIEAGGSAVNAADAYATVTSNGTNFKVGTGAGLGSDVGAAVDNAYHLWKIVVDATNATLTMDGGNSISVAIQADLAPASFGLHVLTTNRIQLAWAHIYYQ